MNKAKLTIKPIDHTRVIQDASSTTLESSAIISRRTRVSTECHATLILDDLMDDILSTDDHRRHTAAPFESATDLEDMMNLLLVELDDDDFIIPDHTCLEQ